MARKKETVDLEKRARDFNDALTEIERQKGISRETVINALKEAMARAYRKELGGDDADVRVEINEETGEVKMYRVKTVRKNVEDDFLEISEEDANEGKKKKEFKDGDEFFIEAPLEELRKATALSIKNILKQKFGEAEKAVLYENFKDKIDTMITGRVERVEERGVSINIGKTSVFLPRKQMIGDERFSAGDPVRLYVSKVSDASSTGKNQNQISVTRSDNNFLRCLFVEEIREIEEGIIKIVNIAREAGERSKVSVETLSPDIDPAGACIGQNGARIQKIVSQLGNSTNKEKIDVINYSPNKSLYVIEALKPARVVGVAYNEENNEAIAVVEDSSLSLAIGKRGINVRLAAKLTNVHIDVKTESDALEEGLVFESIDAIKEAEEARKTLAKIEAAKQASIKFVQQEVSSLPGTPEGYVAPQDRKYEDETSDVDEALASQVEKEEIQVAPAPKVEVKEEVEPAAEATEIKVVKTTTTLSDLERNLEQDDKPKAKAKKSSFKKSNKQEKEEEEVKVVSRDPKTNMSIYTEEELREIEAEEEKENASYDDYEDEDIDYDDYDEYYDDER